MVMFYLSMQTSMALSKHSPQLYWIYLEFLKKKNYVPFTIYKHELTFHIGLLFHEELIPTHFRLPLRGPVLGVQLLRAAPPRTRLIGRAVRASLQEFRPPPRGGEAWLIASFIALQCFTKNPEEAPTQPDNVLRWMYPDPDSSSLRTTRFHAGDRPLLWLLGRRCKNPIWSEKMQLRTVLDVNVVDVQKRRNPSKHYVSFLPRPLPFWCLVYRGLLVSPRRFVADQITLTHVVLWIFLRELQVMTFE